MLKELAGLVRYNRDWIRYIRHRYTETQGDAPLTFRLRNGQAVSVHADARFVLNEIYLSLENVYVVHGPAPS
jgi:hypothetical protein